MCLDFGSVRTGVAVSDNEQRIATPLTTVDTPQLISWLKEYVSRESVERVVVGLPTQLNGSPSNITPLLQTFKKTFIASFPQIPLDEYDERFSSAIAHQTLYGAKKSLRAAKKNVVDKIAACIILEDYMARIEN